MKRAAVIALVIVAAVGLLVWSQRQAGPLVVSGIIEADEIRVGSRVGGRVVEVRVREGERVAAGQTLVVLDPYDLQEQLAQARAELAARRAVLDKLRAGARPEEIERARAERDRARAVLERLLAGMRPLEIQILEDRAEAARADLADAQSHYERIMRLREQEATSEQEVIDATNRLTGARARYDAARHELELAREGTRAELIAEARAALAAAEHALALLEAGFRKEEIAEAEARVASAEAAVQMIEKRLAELNVVAPRESLVEAVDLEPGDLIAPNAPVISLVDPQRLHARAYVPENRLNLRIGQRVQIAVDALPGRRFAGHISFVARTGEFTPANLQTAEERSKQVFRIRVEIDEGQDLLRAGMAADVYFE